MYKKAREGTITHFTGISDPYEPPNSPDVELKTDTEDIETCVARVMSECAQYL